MITLDNEPLSDQAFLERLKDQPYVLQHTGRKGSYKLYLEGKTRAVEGLVRMVRKQLRVEEKPHPSYYRLHPALADRWERLPFKKYWSLKPGANESWRIWVRFHKPKV